ncbi:ribosomal protein L22/L17 [Xylaria arbuscula]|nr:ribosomal protein L22/L17 [Xylaria arbuscula]
MLVRICSQPNPPLSGSHVVRLLINPSIFALPTARASLAKPSLHHQYLVPRTQRRNAGWFSGFFGNKDSKNETPLARELTRREKERKVAQNVSDRTQGSSIFDEEIKASEKAASAGKEKSAGPSPFAYSTMKEHLEPALDPDPRWRVRYQRKKIMQMVRAGGKMTRKEQIKATEKELRSASGQLPTSYKKLMFLSHQVAGKTVEDAITQMRYSKKRMAREVLYQLEEARDTAIAKRGMGLGAKSGEPMVARKIKTKDGKTLEVPDPTRLYIDESWVTKGPPRGNRINHHGRGRRSQMWRPTTFFNVVLKEEKTRIRQHDERVAKEAKKAPWVHLPNRPVTAQRQYYSW